MLTLQDRRRKIVAMPQSSEDSSFGWRGGKAGRWRELFGAENETMISLHPELFRFGHSCNLVIWLPARRSRQLVIRLV